MESELRVDAKEHVPRKQEPEHEVNDTSEKVNTEENIEVFFINMTNETKDVNISSDVKNGQAQTQEVDVKSTA